MALVVTGASAALRDIAASLTGGSFLFTLCVYVVILALINEAISLPLAFYQGVTLERRYGLSTQTTARWWLDHLKAGLRRAFVRADRGGDRLLADPVGSRSLVDPCRRRVHRDPGRSRAACARACCCRCSTSSSRSIATRWSTRLVALADRAGARVMGVFEWRLSDKTKKANAALAGIGQTRRIIISDTLLAEHSDDEIEVILAHELAHHVHRDIWKGIALETALIALGFYLADRVLTRFAGSFGLMGKGDVAALPLLLLAAGAVSLALMPRGQRALARARTQCGSICAGDDEERVRVCQRDEAARRAEPGGGASVTPGSDPVLYAPAYQRPHRRRSGVGGRSTINHEGHEDGDFRGLRGYYLFSSGYG